MAKVVKKTDPRINEKAGELLRAILVIAKENSHNREEMVLNFLNTTALVSAQMILQSNSMIAEAIEDEDN